MDVQNFVKELSNDFKKCLQYGIQKPNPLTTSVVLRTTGVALLAIAALKLVLLPVAGTILGTISAVLFLGVLAHDAIKIGQNLKSSSTKDIDNIFIKNLLQGTLTIGPLYNALSNTIK